MSVPANISPIESQLRKLAAERILVLDGAMGTMIQALKLEEEDFRGARFAAWNRELRGNNDLLNLTQPEAIRDIHLAYLRAGADIVATNTFSSTSIAQADYGMEDIAYELNLAGARLAREAALRGERGGRPAALRRRRHRADQPHRLDLARREQSRLPRRHVRRAARRLCGAGARRCIDGGADLLLLETIFDTLNAKAAIYAIEELFDERGDARAGDDLRHHHRPLRPHAVGPDAGSVLELGPPRRAVRRSASTARSAPRRCAPISPRSRASPTRWSAPIRMPACRTSSGSTTRARNSWPSCSASSRAPASSTSSAAAAAPRPTHIRAIAQAVAGKAPRAIPAPPR